MKTQASRITAAIASVVVTFVLFQGIAVYGGPGVRGGGGNGDMMAANAATPAASPIAR